MSFALTNVNSCLSLSFINLRVALINSFKFIVCDISYCIQKTIQNITKSKERYVRSPKWPRAIVLATIELGRPLIPIQIDIVFKSLISK